MNARTRYTGRHDTRSAYENELADRLRQQLFEMLGGCCAECGAVAPLEIDHPAGRDWKPRKMSRYRRHRIYAREADEGKVRLLCADCNKVILPQRSMSPPVNADNPF